MAQGADEVTAFIGLGANAGQRLVQLRTAIQQLGAHSAIRVVTTSPVYETEAHTLGPAEVQPPYLNAVAGVATKLQPEALLDTCLALERAAGRARSTERARWAPRPLDLDLLTYDAWTCETPRLTLPHPRLAERRFVLRPWADLAPNLYVPLPFDATVQELLDRCPDTTSVRRTTLELAPPPSATT